MGRIVAGVVSAAVLAGSSCAAPVQEERRNLGLVMWSAFECATYAALSGDEGEEKRLFSVGVSVGRQFVNGINDRTISEAERREAPLAVLLLLSGPSVDFMIGRVFEGANESAFDDVVKEDSGGLPFVTHPSGRMVN